MERWQTSNATLVVSVDANKTENSPYRSFTDDSLGDFILPWDDLDEGFERDEAEEFIAWSPRADEVPPVSPMAPQVDTGNSRPSTPANQPSPQAVRAAYEQVRDGVGRILTAALRYARGNQLHEEYNKVQALIKLATEMGPTWGRLQPHAKALVDALRADATLSQYATILWWTVRLLAAMQNGDIAQARFPEYAEALEKGLAPLGLPGTPQTQSQGTSRH